MRNLRKLLALGLALAMTVSLAACGSTDDKQATTAQSTTQTTTQATTEGTTAATTEAVVEKPYEGMNFVVFSQMDLTKGDNEDSYYWAGLLHNALDEWCLENGATWSQMLSKDTEVLMSAIAAGSAPDLYFSYGQWPLVANLGLVQPITEYYDELAEKYGNVYIDMMKYKEDYYGMNLPWNEVYLFKYNLSLFERLGVKTPREYWEEGNWTWTTFQEVLHNITKDTDGDGVNNIVGMGGLYLSERLMPSCTIDETGRISSTLNSNKARVLFQMLYEEITLNGTIYRKNNTNAPTMVAEDNVYIAMNYAKNDIWDPAGLYAVTDDGDIIESVPQPMYEANDPDYKIERNYFQFAVPNGAQNLEASVSIMDYLLEAGCAMEMMLSGLTNYEFTGLRGTTEDSKAYIEKRQKAYEEAKATVEALPEYDTEYIAKLLEYIDSYPAYSEQVYSGVTRKFTSQGAEKWATLYTDPASTSIAAAYPVHQAECDTYNSKYIFE